MIEHWVSISGGKDSTATACLAIERAEKTDMKLRLIFADTGNEHPATIEHIEYLGDKFGIPIMTVQADFSGWMEKRRESLPIDWRKEKRRTRHQKDCPKKGCDCPVSISAPVPENLIARAVELLKPSGNPFLDLCMIKGRFPSRRAQFCTQELKLVPMELEANRLHQRGGDLVSWIGERAEESPGRAAKAQLQRIRMPETGTTKILYRPIKFWTAEQCFQIAKRHDLKPNPLYLQGMGRVGCMPCINCNKNELRQISDRFPDHVEKIIAWEAVVGEMSRRGISSFFSANMIPGTEPNRANIKDAVHWSKTSRGGRNFDLVIAAERITAADEGYMCESAYGLCE